MQSPILELKNIGKIYVSEGNVAVGIRGVNLAFAKGEFVAVTGKSGSGKSTLLNVISGMDTYEEGELYVEGEPTSHFLQKDWEEYRKQYVSFIFQDYNILESFTVLQNVELALMHIESHRERRAKALELLRRVGLEKHIHHKGSKLSGGQKQRTVIARALAKDSPILLCDEPTGNLDSKTSEEIIALLREVSEDKLVIIVTHNFEQVEAYATRHIRIYDGAVDRDQTITRPEPVPAAEAPAAPKKKKKRGTLKNGLRLGWARFCATPKLSVFLCILMTLAVLLITVITSLLNFDLKGLLFGEPYMFTHMKGRTVIVREDGAVMSEEELKGLVDEIGADRALRYDYMLDQSTYLTLVDRLFSKEFDFSDTAGDLRPHVGRVPAADNEVILEVPLSYKPDLEKGGFTEFDLPSFCTMDHFTVVGIVYRVDNTKTPCIHFTADGYRVASAMLFLSRPESSFSYTATYTDPTGVNPPETGEISNLSGHTFVDFGMPAGSYYVNHPTHTDRDLSLTVNGRFNSMVYAQDYGVDYGEEIVLTAPFDRYTHSDALSSEMKRHISTRYIKNWKDGVGIEGETFVVLSADLFLEVMEDRFFKNAYSQASLFFDSDLEAYSKVEKLRKLGYTAVVSAEKMEDADELTFILQAIGTCINAFGWIMTLLFTTLFMILCTTRAMNATRGDIAIMRSMGIPTGVVKLSIHIQTFISLIPAAAVTTLVMTVLYLIPQTNGIFHFLHLKEYALISGIMLIVTGLLSRRYVRKMFKQSVKKTMKGGRAS